MKHNKIDENVVADFIQEEILNKDEYGDLCFLLISPDRQHHDEAVFKLRQKFDLFCEKEVVQE